MKISVVTISYNAVDTIRETIESVLGQDYPDVEYLIIDGGSTDGTLEIVEAYRKEIQYVSSEPDNGVYDAMNKGLARATGDVIAILNADDVYPNTQVLSSVIQSMSAEGTDALYGDLQYVDRVDTSKVFRNWVSGSFKASKFKWGWMPPHPTFFVKRELYLKYGTFNTDLRTSADYELMLRFLFKHKVIASYLPKVLVKMKVGGQSNASLLNRLKGNREDRKAWRINGLTPYPFTTILKPLRKIGQFFGA